MAEPTSSWSMRCQPICTSGISVLDQIENISVFWQMCSAADCAGLHPGPNLHVQSLVAGTPVCLLHALRWQPGGGAETCVHLQGAPGCPLRAVKEATIQAQCLSLQAGNIQWEDYSRSLVSKNKHLCHSSVQGMLLQTLSCVGTSAGVFLSYTLLFVVRTQPWWAPQYFIPILGMMLGNSISGVSVGLSALLEDFSVGECTAIPTLSISKWNFGRSAGFKILCPTCGQVANLTSLLSPNLPKPTPMLKLSEACKEFLANLSCGL